MWSVLPGAVFINAKGKKMRRNLLAVGAAALALACSAQAAEFSAALSGDGLLQFRDPSDTIGMPGGCDPAADPQSTACVNGFVGVDWAGDLVVSTASSVDGVYSYGAGLNGLSFTSNWGDFTYAAGDPYLTVNFIFGTYNLGLAPGASVTIHDGRLSSISGEFDLENQAFFLNGLGASTQIGINANGHYPYSGTLSGPLSPVPEPSYALLLLAGLAWLGARRRPSTSQE